MSFEAADKKLRSAIVQALYQRQTINANKDIGAAYLQAEPEDRVNPSVIVTRDEIRAQTGRSKVRDVIIDEYAESLKGPGMAVEQIDADTLKVTVVPQRVRKNEFGSIQALQARNADDLERDPELGEPMY